MVVMSCSRLLSVPCGPRFAANCPECGFMVPTPIKFVLPIVVHPVKSPVSKPEFTTRFACARSAMPASTAMKRRVFRFISILRDEMRKTIRRTKVKHLCEASSPDYALCDLVGLNLTSGPSSTETLSASHPSARQFPSEFSQPQVQLHQGVVKVQFEDFSTFLKRLQGSPEARRFLPTIEGEFPLENHDAASNSSAVVEASA